MPTPKKLTVPATFNAPPAAADSAASAAVPSPRAGGGGSARGAVHRLHRAQSSSGDNTMKELFSSFDANGDGTIDAAELAAAMTRLGLASSPERLAAIVKEVDADGGGTVSFAEFVSVVERVKTSGGAGSTAFVEVVTRQQGVLHQDKHDNTVHSFAEDECQALVEFINSKLAAEPEQY